MKYRSTRFPAGIFLIFSVSLAAFAQAPQQQTPVRFAHTDLSGQWIVRVHEDQRWRGPGAELGEYQGIPYNAAGRAKASSWDASLNTQPERQCLPSPAVDFTDISNIRIWSEVDPVTRQVIAWHEYTEWGGQERVIWMDGRPHPSKYAPHTWQGFSTGVWERNQLVITTTHLKMALFERVGQYHSDQATLRERWVRHGDYLTVTLILTDPVYLTQPFVRTRDFMLSLDPQPNGWACTPTAEIANRPEGYVPHYLPGKNPFLKSAVERFAIPEIALYGGAETMYPEFAAKLKSPAAPLSRVDPTPAPAVKVAGDDETEVPALPVQGNVYMIAGPGGNTTVQVGEFSVAVVNTQVPQASAKIIEAIRQISKKPIRWVINTDFSPQHTGGNEQIAKAGEPPPQGAARFGRSANDPVSAPIVAHEKVLARMSAPTGSKSDVPFAAWPTETYATKRYELFNGEAIQLIHEPAASTDGDSLVFFRRSDVIATGDFFSMVGYPKIDRKNGGSISGVIAALNHLIELTVPRDKQEGGTYVIPSRGRICDESDVVEYRDMMTIIRDRVKDLIGQRMTLEQIKAARPTLDYDGRYSRPEWTGDMLIEAIYADLSQARN